MRAPITMLVKLVLARISVGMIDASATRRPSTPKTRPSGSTTAPSSALAPIAQVQVGWAMLVQVV